MEKLTVEVIASGLISWLLEILPPLKVRWDKWNGAQKQTAILVFALVLSIGVLAYGWFQDGFPENWANDIVLLVAGFFLNVATMFGAHGSTKQVFARFVKTSE